MGGKAVEWFFLWYADYVLSVRAVAEPPNAVCIPPQDPKDICCHAGFCTETKKSVPMLKLQAAKLISAAKTVPALKLVPAIKAESNTDKAAKVTHCQARLINICITI